MLTKGTVFLICVLGFLSQAQITISGSVVGIDNQVIEKASLVAYPTNKSIAPSFTVSNEAGVYSLELKKGIEYTLNVTHIGYKPYKEIIIFNEDQKNRFIILENDSFELQEIVIKGQAPITVKKDTTTYDVAAFSNGKEVKLRELLKKLPGLTVDREGNVEFKGEKVTELMIDGKRFFFGDPKLGVNNIPANVADEIEVIEDYQETPFYKGLEKSEQIALNIKLKEDKKNFYFGDIEIGGGIENRYVIHPTVFKYSEKLTVNYIGDVNNTVEKSFTLQDYARFLGANDSQSFSDVFSSGVSQSLLQENFVNNSHLFSGFNSQYNPNEKSEFRLSVIGMIDKTDFFNENSLEFLDNNTQENRAVGDDNQNNNLLSLFEYKYKFNRNTSLKNELQYERVGLDNKSIINSSFLNMGVPFEQLNSSTTSSLRFKSEFDKKFNKRHTSGIELQLQTRDNDEIVNTISANNVFNNTIPLLAQQEYHVVQDNDNQLLKGGLDLNHYWVINGTNHLYVESNNAYRRQQLNTLSSQITDDGDMLSLNDYFNNLVITNSAAKTGIRYKKLINSFIIESGFLFQHNSLTIDDINSNNTLIDNSLLPFLDIEYTIDRKNKIDFRYEKDASFGRLDNYATGLQLNSFTSVFKGNNRLDIQRNQKINLTYSYRKIYGFNFSTSFSYRQLEPSIVNNFEVNEIFRRSTLVQIEEPNHFYSTRLRMSYNKAYWRLAFSSTYRYSVLNDIVESSLLQSNRQIFDNSLSLSTSFKDKPNIYTEIKYLLFDNEIAGLSNRQHNFSIDTSLNYDYNDWKFDVSYDFTSFNSNNNSIISTSFFDNLSSTLTYQKEDSLWSYKLEFYNLTNNRQIINTTFSPVSISQIRQVVFPRYALISIIRKL